MVLMAPLTLCMSGIDIFGRTPYFQEGWPPLIYSFFLASSSTFWRTDSHLVELLDEGSEVKLHGYAFFLIFLKNLVYFLCSLQVDIDGSQLSL